MKFKIGDKVNVYNGNQVRPSMHGFVIGLVYGGEILQIRAYDDGTVINANRKQCRAVKTKSRRRIWIPRFVYERWSEIEKNGFIGADAERVGFTAESEADSNPVEFVEVRRKTCAKN